MTTRSKNPLTPTERRLLSLLAFGQTPAQVSAALQIEPAEADMLLATLLSRQELASRQQLIARALVYRWI